VEFLAALSTAGDASCLEAVAAAHARSIPSGGPAGTKPSQRAGEHDWWRDHLADAFNTIVKREQLTGRHAVMRKIQKRWPEIFRSV
jgi:hypothetical protein